MEKMHGLNGVLAMSELSVKELIRELSAAERRAAVEISEDDWGYDADAFHDAASPENIKVLLAYVAELEKERDFLKSLENRVTQLVHDNQDSWEILAEKYKSALEKIAELEVEKSAMEAVMSAIRDDMRQARNELESRRVRVELPPVEPDDGSDAQVAINAGIHNHAVNKCRDAFISACREAGIECEVV